MPHRECPQLNSNEVAGGECGECVRQEAIASFVERAVKEIEEMIEYGRRRNPVEEVKVSDVLFHLKSLANE